MVCNMQERPVFTILIIFVVFVSSSAQNLDNIGQWADTLGEEIWKLGQIVTQATDLKTQYKIRNASVQEKDGTSLLNEIITKVARMLKWKIDAVQCIKTAAEDLAEQYEYEGFENFSYPNARYSLINGNTPREGRNESLYTPMFLAPDPQFYNIPVNTSHSVVQIPTNVYDKAPEVLSSIQWSELLDDVFLKNRRSDPLMTWQYFAGSSGFIRHFPAMQWSKYPDVYDCRTRPWYIEAATCSKDIVILMDTTGSMTGMRHYISKLTVNTILDTLSNNDFVSVMNFSSNATEIVPCFKNMLVQATLENINTFKGAIEKLELDGYANLSRVFTQAFELLEQQRKTRGCGDEAGTLCNQAIMLVTDSVAGNITEVFDKYNRIDNGSTIPVRVFTFLVGKEVTKVMEIMWMACLNRGFYAHIHSLEEVREQVLRYIPVIARPLVLQGVVHPIVWTHAYVDISDPKLENWLWDVMESGKDQKLRLSKHFQLKEMRFNQQKEDSIYAQKVFKKFREPDKIRFQEYKLMTSVSIPAFNKKLIFENENYTDFPQLLGIAGTDIPIEDIEKFTLPHKIGVNGYAFIVSNNGYVLLHPDLRPVARGVLTSSYNSVDLSEVELLDDTRARELNTPIIELREAMVNYTVGEKLNLRMKFHYDDMKRTFTEVRDFYYAPLRGTPFSIAVSLPKSYGYYRLIVGNEIKKTVMKGEHIEEYFEGNNWRIYPKWVYCKYFYSSLHPFESPEEELYHFLEKMSYSDFKWREQYKTDYDEYELDDDIGDNDGFIEMVGNYNESRYCRKEEIDEDEYYCDKDLMNLLVFDAKVFNSAYEGDTWLPNDKTEDEELVNFYNVSIRFIMSQSGLIKWQYVLDSEDHNDTIKFGDIHTEGIYEPWYKGAVLQYQVDPESLYLTVPYDAGDSDPLVTATYAISPRDGGLEVPVAVAGFQFQHSALFSKFMSITTNTNCPDCDCGSEFYDCFVLDNNGYVILSEESNDTGHFFGELEGSAMEAMMEDHIYEKIRIYDYQALCKEEDDGTKGSASMLRNPLQHLQLFVNWMISGVLWILFESSFHQLLYGTWVSANPLHIDNEVEDYIDYNSSPEYEGPVDEEESSVEEDWVVVNKTKEAVLFPCDQKTNLYLLLNEPFIDEGYCSPAIGCFRPYCIKRIPHTNLVFLVIDSSHEKCYKKLSIGPKTLDYGNSNFTHSCRKLDLNNLPRRRLGGCFTEHPMENTKHMCGNCITLSVTKSLFVVTFLILLFGKLIYTP